MPFNRPTLADLVSRAESDIQSRLSVGPLLKRGFLYVISRVVAGAAHQLYGNLEWASRQLFPDTADAENLERWASIWGIQRNAATYASGSAQFSGTNGVTVASGTILQRGDGVQYVTTVDATIASGTSSIPVTAVVAGSAGNVGAGTSLSLVEAQSGVGNTIAAGEISGGADTESDAALRGRLLERIKQAPHGGSQADYESWAKANAAVTRAWVYPSYLGVGSVGVAIVSDDRDGGPLPDTETVDAVQTYIEARRPVTADVTVFAPTESPINLQVHVAPDTEFVRAAVIAELEDLIRRDSKPGGKILLSRIREAVSIAAGESDNSVVSPTANHQADEYALPVIGTVEFV
ncbi:baseplate J/gp47 family protein [Jiella pelagia]|uniref:Baseplate J/gp47 family protein n=1 Tax=Jiella pelagia TaxID=2986949 RepID=A0ABY7BZ40_9HYPH|nr:baseplate J/gp47 family protein [Jiella pelagia]WAP69033.1 baseplate J/gp47 family protein [Jiella pelagia]